MRISSMQIFNIARQSMAGVNQDLVKTQEQMSSGKRVMTAADDPVAATKIMQLEDQSRGLDQYIRNIDVAYNNLALEESVMSGVTNNIQRLQELAVSAGNTATLTKPEFDTLAQEVSVRLDELVNLMNTKSPGGDFIFGGYQSSEAPFTGNSTLGFEYRGDSGQQQIQIASNTYVAASDSGQHAFMNIPVADSEEKQALLTIVADFKNGLESFESSAEGRELFSEMIASTLASLSSAHDSIQSVTTSIGARLNTLETTRDLHLDSQLMSKDLISQLRDLDYAEASTRLSQQTLVLQAAQQSFVRVSQLSLFNKM